MKKKIIKVICSAVALVLVIDNQVYAGKLREFEKAATGKDTSKKSQGSSNSSSSGGASSSGSSSSGGYSSSGSSHRRSGTKGYKKRHAYRHHYVRPRHYYNNHYYVVEDHSHTYQKEAEKSKPCREIAEDGIENYDSNYDYFLCGDGTIVKTIKEQTVAQEKAQSSPMKVNHINRGAHYTNHTKAVRQNPTKTQLDRILEPDFTLDFAIGTLDSNLDMEDFKFQFGHSDLSASMQFTKIIEDYEMDGLAFRDTLNLRKFLVKHRRRMTENAAFEVGLGGYFMSGVFKTRELAAHLGGKYYLDNGFVIDFSTATTLGGDLNLTDFDIALGYNQDFFTARLGYKSFIVEDTDKLELNGPYIGISFSF